MAQIKRTIADFQCGTHLRKGKYKVVYKKQQNIVKTACKLCVAQENININNG